MHIVFFILGLLFLISGAELLVRGASSLAKAYGISSLTIGLTVVAFGTSSPELAVSVKAALSGQAGIAIGNVVGSNTFNILFILGLSALICPLFVSVKLIRIDVPIMIGVSVLALVLAWDRQFSRPEGLLLFGGLILYTTLLIYEGRKQPPGGQPDSAPSDGTARRSLLADLGFMLAGLGLLAVGSRWLVTGAETFARFLGVDQLIISLTIVAAGTSLPEVFTSVVASLRGERDIAVGNIVGSNLFNILGVLGLSALLAPSPLEVAPSLLSLDIPLMIAVAFACLPIFFTGGRISRWEGGLLFAYYIAYTTYLVLEAMQHEALPAFHVATVYFAVPLTVVTLGVVTLQSVRSKRSNATTPQDAG